MLQALTNYMHMLKFAAAVNSLFAENNVSQILICHGYSFTDTNKYS